MFIKKEHFILIFFCLLSSSLAEIKIIHPSKELQKTFAIVIDKITFNKTENAVLTYKEAVEEDGLSVYVLINDWKNPEEIKRELKRLYELTPQLEGAVFIGDIPVPMISKAQHLTSAFKMDEDSYPPYLSSVPSDRFYDDFDLKFRFISRDSLNPLCYYYALTADSPQKIESEIYTARIKYSGVSNEKYKGITDYLFRAAREKKKKNIINNALVFTGYGYYSGSLTAWADKRISLMEQFPQLFAPGGRVKNIFHSMNDEIKERLLSSLQDPELDIALFHNHGSADAQMVIDYPAAKDAKQNADALKLFLRSKLRAAKRDNLSVQELKDKLTIEYNISDEWFDGAFDNDVIIADSINKHKLNIYVEDIRKTAPAAKFIMFHQCYSGPFHLDQYMAGEYLFRKGNVIAAEVNSVNVLQDKWTDEFLGLLNLGGRIGEWHLRRNLLESHIIGDPTYRFTPAANGYDDLIFTSESTAYWEGKLKSSNPVIRDFAVGRLYSLKSGKSFEEDLVRLYKKDPSLNVRLHALKYISELNRNSLKEILKYSVNDPHEYIRRISALLIGRTGDKELLPLIAEQLFNDESERVLFNARTSLTFFNSYEANNACITAAAKSGSSDKLLKLYQELIINSERWFKDNLIKNIQNDSLSATVRIQEIRSFRTSRFHEAVPVLLGILKNNREITAVRTAAAEVLGWFNLSIYKDRIIDELSYLLKERLPDAVNEEIIRSVNRLEQGANDPVLL